MPRITVGHLPVPKQPTKELQPKISDVDYKHSIVSTRHQPLVGLISHVEGSSWTVDYYSQVIGSDEELAPFDPSQTAPYQQYTYIKNYELRLQGQLSTSVDTQDQQFNITGNALCYPYMRPNVGDAFIADMGDGQAGLFTVTEVEKKTYFKQACYEIQFVLARYVDESLENNINSKVVKSTEFVKDFLVYGQNPILATEDKLKLDKLEELFEDVLSDWLYEFYSVEYKTILVPTGIYPTYDPFLTKAITRVIDQLKHPLLNKITLFNTDDDNLTYYEDIWTVIIERQLYKLRNCFDEYYLLNPNHLSHNPFIQTAYWSGIRYILMPKMENRYTDERLGIRPNIGGAMLLNGSVSGSKGAGGTMGACKPKCRCKRCQKRELLAAGKCNEHKRKQQEELDKKKEKDYDSPRCQDLKQRALDPNNQTPSKLANFSVPDISGTFNYVFSQDFYHKSTAEGMSDLEYMVKDYLNNRAIDWKKLVTGLEQRHEWTLLQRFYAVPVMLFLTLAEIRGI